ncbi:MAG: VOC family protein [Dehalococcoidia bacterium]|nr:VOC family protein [Dehalococcoidia bacterium]
MAQITRLNHAVLYVSDLDRSVEFYKQAFGMEEIAREGGMMAFLRAHGSDNHHDLGLFNVGTAAARPPRGAVGLYHLAWQVDTIDDLAEIAPKLADLNALTGASDHGATKSLYGRDPDGIEFEVMWLVPREQWGEYEKNAITRRLDLQAELERFGSKAGSR